MKILDYGIKARAVEPEISLLDTETKNKALVAIAKALEEETSKILNANEKDYQQGLAKGMSPGMLDRLKLDEERVRAMAEGMTQVATLPDPIGEILSEINRPNGLKIVEKRVPLGVIGIIYESRPNVTADAFALCFKTGNVVILKGGSDAINSNLAIAELIRESLAKNNISPDALQVISDTNREATKEFMKLQGYVDVLIPRGGAGLIKTVVENSTIPVIETGSGNCHIYVDESADLNMAMDIIFNAKTQRIGVCNAAESLLVHHNIASKLLPALEERLQEKNVELRGDEESLHSLKHGVAATEEDWGKEYLDYILSVKTVEDVEEAIKHINHYNTKHSEAIITENAANAEKFLNQVDAAAVYWNASTRFTDGFEFGYGAEIGISTQRLHARGPMGLEALTSKKFNIYGTGQTRP